MTSSLAPGSNTSVIEVTNISAHGVWVLVRDKELFMSYEDFPWFKDQTVKSITNVVEQTRDHLYWSDLDVDLNIDIIENPERFPLIAES